MAVGFMNGLLEMSSVLVLLPWKWLHRFSYNLFASNYWRRIGQNIGSSKIVSWIKSRLDLVSKDQASIAKAGRIVLIDILLGTLFAAIFIASMNPKSVVEKFSSLSTEGKLELESLLKWLMGAPAGLKLNKEFTAFLGRVFLYHVYIWGEYLHILEQYLPVIIHVTLCLGIGGLSLMLAVTYDVLNLLSLHVYCFYVYATRLYSLQIGALISLARLFRGKKWNKLRTRVDSLPSDVDQLTLGTILFTILLFLLPTTLVYYTVFAALRLITFHIQWLLSMTIKILHTSVILDGIEVLFGRQEGKNGNICMDLDWSLQPNERDTNARWSLVHDNKYISPSHVCNGLYLPDGIYLSWVEKHPTMSPLKWMKVIRNGYSIKHVLHCLIQGIILKSP